MLKHSEKDKELTKKNFSIKQEEIFEKEKKNLVEFFTNWKIKYLQEFEDLVENNKKLEQKINGI